MNNKEKLVYIVDDEAGINDLMEFSFEKEGFDVQTFQRFSDCQKAIEIVMPDILISDLVIEGEDAISFLKKLKSDYPRIQIQIVSGYLTTERIQKLKKLNLSDKDITSKPFDINEFILKKFVG